MSETQTNQTKHGLVSKYSLKRIALTLGGSFLFMCAAVNAQSNYGEGVVGTLRGEAEAPSVETEQSQAENILLESPAIKEWYSKCSQGDYASCNILAQVYLEQKLYPQAALYLEKVCYSNSPDADTACAGLTSLLSFDAYQILNLRKAQEVARHLCETKQVSFGCVALSQLYLNPELKDTNRSFEYAQKACDLNDATGCKQVALTIYSQAYGQKDIQMAKLAFDFYKKACELGDEDSCKTYAPHEEKLKQFQMFVQRSEKQVTKEQAEPFNGIN